MEEAFGRISGVIASFIEAGAVLIVAFGCAEAFVRLSRVVTRPDTSHGERKVIWRRLGVWPLLGLEFELAADISEALSRPPGRTLVSSARLR